MMRTYSLDVCHVAGAESRACQSSLRYLGFCSRAWGRFVVQNNPGEVRNNICAWDFVAPCPDWFDSAAVNQAVFLFLVAVSGLFFLSLIIPLLAENYRQTVTGIAQFTLPKKPSAPQNETHDFALANKPLSPDWSMKELYRYVLDNNSDSEEVFREIEAKARLGELACWGRKYSTIKADDNPNPLRPIVREHWDDFSLDYLRCVMHEDPTECRTEPRDSRGDHTGSYQDLHVGDNSVTIRIPMQHIVQV